MEYGLIGYPLGHSFSKIIHEELKAYPYEICPVSENELDVFLHEKKFKGINITIPYKQKVLKYLDFTDNSVINTGACNTIVHKNNKLYGYNTDYFGFEYLLKKYDIELKNKIVIILGSGGTYQTVSSVCKNHQASAVYCVSRKKQEDSITLEDLYQLKADILINTTPVGMFPNQDEIPLEIKRLNGIQVVIDVIYNPIQTKLILEAKKQGIKAYGGLIMLVAQALSASEKFLDKQIDSEEIEAIFHKIATVKKNIVLIGMPMSGKSSIGEKLSKILNKEFVDLDQMIEVRNHMPIPKIFELKGEAHFRMLEKQMTELFATKNDLIISTGGGIVEDSGNISKLKQNGFIVYLSRDFDKVVFNDNRPLAKNRKDIEILFAKRKNLYEASADVCIPNNGSMKKCAEKIKEAFYESINY